MARKGVRVSVLDAPAEVRSALLQPLVADRPLGEGVPLEGANGEAVAVHEEALRRGEVPPLGAGLIQVDQGLAGTVAGRLQVVPGGARELQVKAEVAFGAAKQTGHRQVVPAGRLVGVHPIDDEVVVVGEVEEPAVVALEREKKGKSTKLAYHKINKYKMGKKLR